MIYVEVFGMVSLLFIQAIKVYKNLNLVLLANILVFGFQT